jgi:hypothetical protein
MPSDWARIRTERPDITDWVIHWTRGRVLDRKYESPFDVLKCLLQCGYLKPSFAPFRSRATGRGQSNTIEGPHPAVCFTDQPVSSFIISCRVLPSRYHPYGVALDKRNLFEYGGRPVIYGDGDLLTRLDDEDKYLWVGYNPVPSSSYAGYPVDWVHEREWRARVKEYSFIDWGVTPDEGVPLFLPPICNGEAIPPVSPKLLVKTLDEAKDLREYLNGFQKYEGRNGFIRMFSDNLMQLQIVPLDYVHERLENGDNRWGRFETLPFGELREGISKRQG